MPAPEHLTAAAKKDAAMSRLGPRRGALARLRKRWRLRLFLHCNSL